MAQNAIRTDRAQSPGLLGSLEALINEVKRGAPDYLEFRSNFSSFCTRIAIVFRHPTQLAPIFLDCCSLLHSLWDERRSGPSFIAPMSSLTKRPSGRLSRLLLQHSRDLPKYESGDAPPSQESNSHSVAVIHLNGIPQGSIKADLHGLMSLLVFIETLILVLLPSWLNRASAVVVTLLVCAYATISGDGTLTLVRQSDETHDAPTPGSNSCAVLLGEDLTVVVKGPEVVIEAITNGGFHLSRTFVDILHRPAWSVARDNALEGFFQGLLYSMLLLLARLLGLQPLIPLLPTVLGLPLAIPMCNKILQTAFQRPLGANVTPGKPVDWLETIGTELLRMIARGVPFGGFLLLCMYTSAGNYVPRLGDLVQLALLLNLLPFVSLAVILSIPSQNYPLQSAKFLDVLDNPPAKKWQFKTPAAAAAFQCLVLCDDLDRPTRGIDVRGVLDTLILDQRDVWGAWKARVADRITHEEHISFAPTLPTFRDEVRQTQLKEYLDEAQRAYETYRTYRMTYPGSPLA